MSKVAIQGNASGTGTFTIAAPNSNTDRTLTLPDEAGTVLTSGATDLANTVSQTQVAFQVEATDIDQSLATGAWRKVQFEYSQLDSHSYWDATNHRYTPQVAGWYLFSGAVRCALSATVQQFISIAPCKNGDTTATYQSQYNFNADIITNGTWGFSPTMIYLNGTTDYVELYIYLDEDATISDSASAASWFNGFLVRQA